MGSNGPFLVLHRDFREYSNGPLLVPGSSSGFREYSSGPLLVPGSSWGF